MQVDGPAHFFTVMAVFVVLYAVACGLVSIAARYSGRPGIPFFFTLLLLGGGLFVAVGTVTDSTLLGGLSMFLVPFGGLIATTSDER